MTPAQSKVIEHVENLLKEHFEAHVVIVAYDATNSEDKELFEGKAVYWGGGPVHCLGIATYGAKVLERRCFEPKDKDPE